MKISKKVFLAVASFLSSTGIVFAQSSTSSWLPQQIQDLLNLLGVGGAGTATKVTSTIQTVIVVVLGLIIVVAIVYSIMAGIKYIRSEGDPGKIEEAQKAIKAILMGIAAIFVGILGVVLVFVLFNQGTGGGGLPQVCISANGSVACQEFRNSGDINNDAVQWCEEVYRIVSTKEADGSVRFTKGLQGTQTDRINIAKLAKLTSKVDPTTIDIQVVDPTNPAAAVSFSSLASDDEKSVMICIDPLQGGFIPVNK